MTVAEMLSRISSPELSMWKAYEQAFGPLDNTYRDDVLAAIHEMLQAQRHFMGEVWAESGKNPIDEPRKLPRPDDLYERARREDDDENPDDDAVSTPEEFNQAF